MTQQRFGPDEWLPALAEVMTRVGRHDVDLASVMVTPLGVTLQIGGTDMAGVDAAAAEFYWRPPQPEVPSLYSRDVSLDGIPVHIYTGRPE